MRRSIALLVGTIASLLVIASAAQAAVVSVGGGDFGVALVPGTAAHLAQAGITPVTSSARCTDPWLASDLGGMALPTGALCYRGGAVLNQNETFALTWDPTRRYWAGTRGYVESFLKNVANGSGTLTSPYAVTSQYQDLSGRALNQSLYGGGCIDYGSVAGFTCQFPTADTTGLGLDYPQNGCNPTGFNNSLVPGGGAVAPNDICLTDAQIKSYLQTIIPREGLASHTQPGHAPVIVMLTPPGVVSCLDAAATLCSANSTLAPPIPTLSTSTTGGTITAGTYQVVVTYVTATGETMGSAPATATTTGGTSTQTGGTSTITIDSPPAVNGATGWYVYVAQAGSTTFTRQLGSSSLPIGTNVTLTSPPSSSGSQPPANSTPEFCSYHSQVTVPDQSGPTTYTYVVQPWTALAGLNTCDEPDISPIPQYPTADQLSTGMGARLVSPLSQSEIGAVVDPALNGWVANTGAEINDNGCTMLQHNLDSVTVSGVSYFLQREFNNGGVIETDPNALPCAPNVQLTPKFVVPSTVNAGTLVQFDGSTTDSSLVVPQAGYTWSFGDGTTASGPSVPHAYKYGGTYTVTLNVVDRGGYKATLSQPITVAGPPSPNGTPSTPTASIRLLPATLRQIIRGGIQVVVNSKDAAGGIASIMIPHAAAKRAHIRASGQSVVIARGTVASLPVGTTNLRLHIAAAVGRKLEHLSHVTMTVRLVLQTAARQTMAIQAAGQY